MSRTLSDLTVNASNGFLVGPVGAAVTVNANATANASVYYPTSNGAILINNVAATLFNKNITDASDNVVAGQLLTGANTLVAIAASGTPSIGNALIAANASALAFGTVTLNGIAYLSSSLNIASIGNTVIHSVPVPDAMSIQLQSKIMGRFAVLGGPTFDGILNGGFKRVSGNASLQTIANLTIDTLSIVDNASNNQLNAFLVPNTSSGNVDVVLNTLNANATSFQVLTSYIVI